MTFTYLCFLLTLHVIAVTSAGDTDWCYETQKSCSHNCKAPREWTTVGYCNGKEQSPINIVTRDTKYKDLKAFKFSGYNVESEFELKNNGHTAELSLEGKAEITISGGGLSGTYSATQLHFHWGTADMSGSEHSIDGVRYAAELHIVHTLKSSKRSETDGGTTGRNIAVLGFFIEETSNNNSKYNNIIDALNSIQSKDNTVSVSKVILKELISEDLEHFYRYEGSLTTPQCNETVTWTVFPETIKLGKAQLQAFYTKLNYSADIVMVDNFRPIQKLGDRTVYTSDVEAVLSHNSLLLLSCIAAYLTSTS